MYDPAVTAVFARSMVPVVVMVPPLRPVPAVMLVTVPPLTATVVQVGVVVGPPEVRT